MRIKGKKIEKKEVKVEDRKYGKKRKRRIKERKHEVR